MSRPISAIATSAALVVQPRHLRQPLDGVAKGRKGGLEARIECRHRLLQLLDSLQMLIEKNAVMVPDTAVEEPVTEFDRRPFEHPLLSPGTVAGQLRSASVLEHVR